MSLNFPYIVVKFFAGLAMLFGFVVGGLEVYFHYIKEGESAWKMLPFALAAISITWGALMLQREDTSAALDKLVELVPFIGSLIATRRPGGKRITDPPLEPPQSPRIHPVNDEEVINTALEDYAARQRGKVVDHSDEEGG